MLKLQFDGDVLVVQPESPITREDVAMLMRTADEYLAGHPKIAGVTVETRTFPGFASVGAFADYASFIANHHAHVRRVALVTNSALAPVAEFMANTSLAWRCGTSGLPRARRQSRGSGRPEGVSARLVMVSMT